MDGGPSCRTRGDRFVAQARAEARLRHVLLRAEEGRAPLRDHFLDGSCPFSTDGSEGFPIAGRSISRPVEERVSTRPQRLPLGSAPVAGEDRAISSAVDVASMAFPVSLPSSFRGSGPHASRRSSSSVPRIVPFRSVPVPLRSLLAPRPAEDPPGPVGSKGIGPRTKGWTRSPSPSVPVPIPFCPCPCPGWKGESQPLGSVSRHEGARRRRGKLERTRAGRGAKRRGEGRGGRRKTCRRADGNERVRIGQPA